jgi:effector-binding domain-containing protein
MHGYQIRNVSERPYLYTLVTTSRADMDMAIMAGFDKVWRHMSTHGIAHAGGNLTVFTSRTTEELNIRTGCLIAESDMHAVGHGVRAAKTPGGSAVYHLHHGSYNNLPKAYGRMLEYCRENGMRPTMPSWQIYKNDPSDVLEEQLITDCYQSLHSE